MRHTLRPAIAFWVRAHTSKTRIAGGNASLLLHWGALTFPSMTATQLFVVPRSMPMTSSARTAELVLRYSLHAQKARVGQRTDAPWLRSCVRRAWPPEHDIVASPYAPDGTRCQRRQQDVLGNNLRRAIARFAPSAPAAMEEVSAR
jgi:hypothetical protein